MRVWVSKKSDCNGEQWIVRPTKLIRVLSFRAYKSPLYNNPWKLSRNNKPRYSNCWKITWQHSPNSKPEDKGRGRRRRERGKRGRKEKGGRRRKRRERRKRRRRGRVRKERERKRRRKRGRNRRWMKSVLRLNKLKKQKPKAM